MVRPTDTLRVAGVNLQYLSRRQFLAWTATAVGGGATLLRAGSDSEAVAPVHPFFRVPSIHNLSPNGASILWATSSPAEGAIRLRTPGIPSRTIVATTEPMPAAVTGLQNVIYQHRVDLTGLTPDTPYTYEIRLNGTPVLIELARPFRFRTPDPKATAFQFLHFADSGDGGDGQMQLLREIAREDPAFILANGDLAYDLATQSDVEKHYFGVYRDLMAEIPFFATLGNHEYYTEAGRPALRTRVSPSAQGVPANDEGRYYSFDWGNAHFVALDTNWPLIQAAEGHGRMLDWLEADLSRTRKFWRIAVFHHPPFATGKHQDTLEAVLVRKHVVPILERHGVQLAFHGHEHTYQRSREILGGKPVAPNSGGIVYITSGGGGATTYWVEPNEWVAESIGMNHYVRADVQGSKLTLRVRGIDQEQDFDTFQLAPAPVLHGPITAIGGESRQIATGGLAWISGRNLCPDETGELCSVTLNGAGGGDKLRVRVVSADANRLVVQLPMTFRGDTQLAVATANGAAETRVTVQAVAPVLFAQQGRASQVWAQHSDGELVDPQLNPVRPGAPVTVTATGLGAVDASSQAPVAAVQVRLGGFAPFPADRVRLLEDRPGVYEVQFTMPETYEGGPVTIQLLTAGVASNRLLI